MRTTPAKVGASVMNFLDRIEDKLSGFFSRLFRQPSGQSKDSQYKDKCKCKCKCNAADSDMQAEPIIEDTKAYRKTDLGKAKEESTTRVYYRISDPDVTAVREIPSFSEIPLVRFEVIHGLDKEAAFEFGITQGIIGRSSGSLIELSDPNVSRTHARLEIKQTQTVIYDNNSTNGTKVNGHRITKQILHNGDIISVGKTELCFAVVNRAGSQKGRR